MASSKERQLNSTKQKPAEMMKQLLAAACKRQVTHLQRVGYPLSFSHLGGAATFDATTLL